MDIMKTISDILIWLPAILIALTFHEYAHGKMADYLGDDTPYHQGRLTLNPLPHIDWVGFIMLLIFKFGWAKPVQVNPLNFKGISIKKGMMMVALAGPAMNIFIAFIGTLMIRFMIPLQGSELGQSIIILLQPLVWINIILAVFNMIPVPPLDGSKILAGLLPDSGADLIYSLEQYGPLILLLLILSGAIGTIILPLANIINNFLDALIL